MFNMNMVTAGIKYILPYIKGINTQNDGTGKASPDCTAKKKHKKMNVVRSFLNDDTKDNIMYLFMSAAILMTIMLLAVPVYGLVMDIHAHSMITTDLGGVSTYIGAVASIFTAAGACTAWTQWAHNKYGLPDTSAQDTPPADTMPQEQRQSAS